jgi:hypothetical protein
MRSLLEHKSIKILFIKQPFRGHAHFDSELDPVAGRGVTNFGDTIIVAFVIVHRGL